MFINKCRGRGFLVLAMMILMLPLGRETDAQLRRSKPGERKSPGSSLLKNAQTEKARPASDTEKEASEEAKTKTSPGLAGWIRANKLLVVGVPLGAAALGLSWFFLVGKRKKQEGAGAFLKPVTDEGAAGPDKAGDTSGGFSSTRIRAVDVDARLSGTMDGEEVETDQDYALVVEEEALSAADTQEDAPPQDIIAALLQDGDADGAYETYARLIDEESSTRLDSAIEQTLGEQLIAAGKAEKASTVLEHHIATHPAQEIEAESYFNLGYAHFHSQRMEKSRKYFGLFIEAEEDEKRRDRARAILSAMEAD